MSLIPFYLGSALIGALVGTVEIFQRYPADPLQTISNRWALFYVLFNALMAALAYYIVVLSVDLTPTSEPLVKLQWMALAGFGAVAFLHTKLLNINVPPGREVALGPEVVVQTFLTVIDRELDRARAKERFESVRRLMEGIDFDKAKIRLPIQIFQAMQQVTEEETQILLDRIAEIEETPNLTSQDKSYILGFYLLDLVGERFLSGLLPKYRSDFEMSPANPSEDDSEGRRPPESP